MGQPQRGMTEEMSDVGVVFPVVVVAAVTMVRSAAVAVIPVEIGPATLLEIEVCTEVWVTVRP